MPKVARAVCSSIAVAVLSASAWAQGYVVTAHDLGVEARPASATALDVDSVRAEKACAAVTLPFAFRYYGDVCKTLVVSAHGFVVPGATAGVADDASADGVVAPMGGTITHVADGTPGAGRVFTWTSGAAPSRRFVVSWEDVQLGEGPRITVQVQLHEGAGRIVFAYAARETTGAASPTATYVCGLDEPRGARFVVPMSTGAANVGVPPADFVFEPRTVLFNSPDAGKDGAEVVWQDVRRESLTGPGSAKGACWVAKGRGWFFVPDRDLRAPSNQFGRARGPTRAQQLLDEDRAEFGGAAGDAERWVKQVLDAKAILVPKDGGPNVRVWFRIIEWFTVDEWGTAGPDEHVWSLRKMLHQAFAEDDPRARIDSYVAWRGMVSSRLSVAKLFDFDQRDDAGKQYDSNRKNEYVLWCARFRTGARGPLTKDDAPRAGWTRFRLKDDDKDASQHADVGDLRDVRDPEYVDGGYAYTIRSDGSVAGWEALPTAPRAALTEEEFDFDPPPAGGTSTPR